MAHSRLGGFPEELRARKNPLGSDAADIAAGRDLFRQKWELCHAYDGGGKTQIGGDEYARAPSLRTAVACPPVSALMVSPERPHLPRIKGNRADREA